MYCTRDDLLHIAGSFMTNVSRPAIVAMLATCIVGPAPTSAAVPPFYPDTAAFDSVEAARRQVATAESLGMPVVDTVWLADTVPMEMRVCPAGRYLAGSPATENGHETDETLRIDTVAQPFYLSTTVLTQRQYRAFMGSLPPGTSVYQPDYTARVDFWPIQDSLYPKMQPYAPSGWKFAIVTQLQGEYACRAGTHTEWYTGTTEAGFAASAWYYANSGGVEHPVGQKIPNAWGFRDMLGNVWQWATQFWLEASYHYDTRRADDMHLVRGGAYDQPADGNACRSANVMVQMVASAFRVAMNCTTNLMSPTPVVPASIRTAQQCRGISVAGDRIVINQTLGGVGLVEFISVNGKKTHMTIETGLQKSQTIRFKDLGLTPGTYLMRVTQGRSSVEQKLNVW